MIWIGIGGIIAALVYLAYLVGTDMHDLRRQMDRQHQETTAALRAVQAELQRRHEMKAKVLERRSKLAERLGLVQHG